MASNEGKKLLKVEWKPITASTETILGFRGDKQTKHIPAGLESTDKHRSQMEILAAKPGKVVRKDGDPTSAFKNAAKITDGVGNAFFGEMTFKDGVPEKNNFHQYRMIRMGEAPKAIEVHYVENEINPTGMREPPFPPIFGAVANALYKATGERRYRQPFLGEENVLG